MCDSFKNTFTSVKIRLFEKYFLFKFYICLKRNGLKSDIVHTIILQNLHTYLIKITPLNLRTSNNRLPFKICKSLTYV